jgi:hypothetical protein
MLGRAHAQSLQGIPHPDDLLGFVYEVDMTTGQIRSLIEEGIRILRFEPSDGSYYRISPNPGATPPWDNRLIGVPAAPLPRNWSLIGGKGSRFGWCCLASNSVTGARAAWRFSRATGTWVQLPIPNCDEVVDISEDGLVVVREYLSPGYAAYHSIAADGSIRNYASPDISYFEGANSHGLVLYRTQVFEHATGFETAFPGPLNMIDINDTGAVVGTEGYYQLSPATALLDCSRDTVAPTLSCPGSVEALDSKSGSPGEIVFFTMTALDDTDPTPSVLCVPPSGSFFPRGTTIVTCTATDASGNQSVCLFPVVVMPTIR